MPTSLEYCSGQALLNLKSQAQLSQECVPFISQAVRIPIVYLFFMALERDEKKEEVSLFYRWNGMSSNHIDVEMFYIRLKE